MPAINPARLKNQCVETASSFTDPPTFLRKLHALMNFYADRVFRPGESGAPPPLIRSYQVPTPILKNLTRELSPYIAEFPEQSLELADLLWEEKWLETRQLAAMILQEIHLDSPQAILDRVRQWADHCGEEILLEEIFNRGLARVRDEQPRLVLTLAAELLDSGEKHLARGALYALPPLLREEHFEDLPAVFNMLSSFLLTPSRDLVPEIVGVVQSLTGRSEVESVYFLLEELKTAAQPRITRVVRRSLAFFSPENEQRLARALRDSTRG